MFFYGAKIKFFSNMLLPWMLKMFMVKKILHLYKLPHHHTFLIPEADHIESGGEV